MRLKLQEICNKIFQENTSISKLDIMYRTNDPDGNDMLFGYCIVNKDNLGNLSIISVDGDDYSLDDIINSYTYDSSDYLVVWFTSEWSNSYDNELQEDLLLEQREQM